MTDKNSPISVWVGNLGKYNEGELVGGWIDLPASEERIEKYLRDEVLIGTRDSFGYPYEEYSLFDYEFSEDCKAFYSALNEWSGLESANNLAALLSELSEYELAAVAAYYENENYNLDELCNVILQADSLEFYPYTNELTDLDEKLAYSYLDGESPGDFLSRDTLERHFDYEGFGQELSYNVTVGDEGYIPDGLFNEPDPTTLEELAEDEPELFEAIKDIAENPEMTGDAVSICIEELGLDDYQAEALNLIHDDLLSIDATPLVIAAIAMDIDDVPYIPFTSESSDPDIQLAETEIEILGGIENLSQDTLEEHFDYKAFGQELASYYVVSDEGYYPATASVCKDLYSHEEITQEAKEIISGLSEAEAKPIVAETLEKMSLSDRMSAAKEAADAMAAGNCKQAQQRGAEQR